jgi:hypothetical protein
LKLAGTLIITIDTEEDCWGDYRNHDNPVENIGQIPMLQALFDQYGAMPTYLVDWPVLADDRARDILRGILVNGRCEIGSHCHPWNTPPFDESITNRNSMLCNLPSGLVKAKLSNLYNATVDRLQVEPQSFRAGRWGFGQDVATGLIEAGYRVDSSVCPGVDWRSDFGPDYSDAPDTPYRFRADDILRPDLSGELLEVPATTSFLQRNLSLCRSLRRTLSKAPAKRFHLLGLLDRLKLLNFRWFSPELTSGPDMIRLCRAMLGRGSPTLNMSFHSTTLLPGKSPYVRSWKDLDAFLERIRAVLEFAGQNRVGFAALSSLREQTSQSLDTR